ncbi:hypothetical protein FOCC_FOCC006594 [Frankliniella occidentalis]|uniref:Serine/threonine-protein kinase pelle-like isoform X1 n=1 Tax=Frankliniella occidentalis TaxID=133901 RepID=A0A6J1SHZ1_FRAOC|nr:serine/threonine-protein kinase pelle-like isoform X1 [Frankliniella occidentalis]KAE8746610.1 hypothetical protein FOCC_FOCC006594 [Frankliniella occidentalis]
MSTSPNCTYIYELPENVRIRLCFVLNIEDCWKWLHAIFYDAEEGRIRYDQDQIMEVCGTSPSSQLLKVLGDRNFTIDHLYLALASLNLPRAMGLLEVYVSDHIKNSERLSVQQEEHDGIQFIKRVGSSKPAPDNQIQQSPTPYVSPNSPNLDSVKDSPQQGNDSVKPAYSSRGVVSYQQIIQATNNWDSKNSLDSTRKVNFYCGQLNGEIVAIKKLGVQKHEALEEIRKLRDASKGCDNILEMLMFIEGSGNPCLIYPFVLNRSLYDFINIKDNPHLTVDEKLGIAYGIANALTYLHHNVFQSVVLVKSSDILLGESMSPLIADVCLPSMVHEKKTSRDLSLYIPQEGSKGENPDVFCLGTIALELAVGQTVDKLPTHPEIYVEENPDIIKTIPQMLQALIKVCYELWSLPESGIDVIYLKFPWEGE